MQRLAIVLGLVVLSSCTYTYRWALPTGATDQQLQTDSAACAEDGEKSSQGLAGTNAWTVYEQCMVAKGYKKTGGSWRL